MLPLRSTITDAIHPAHEANPWIVQSRNWLQAAHAEILSNRVSLRFRFSVRSDQARVWVFGVANICKLVVCGFCKEAQTSALVNPPRAIYKLRRFCKESQTSTVVNPYAKCESLADCAGSPKHLHLWTHLAQFRS